MIKLGKDRKLNSEVKKSDLQRIPKIEVNEKLDKKSPKKSTNHKGNIKFKYSSFMRRNIDKALVRSLSTIRKEVKSEIFEEYKIQSIDKSKYFEIAMSLDKINDSLKANAKEKNYGPIINDMINEPAYRIVLKKCLERKKDKILEPSSKRIKRKNQEVYLTTLNDYLDYISNL